MKVELGMKSSWAAVAGARLADASTRSDVPEFDSRVVTLMSLSVRGIARMYRPECVPFPQTMRGERSDSGPRLVSEGQNLRYAAIVALGLSRTPLPEQREALHGSSALELARVVEKAARGHDDLGVVALAAWALSEISGSPAVELLDELARRVRVQHGVQVVILSWSIVAFIAGGRLDLAQQYAKELMSSQGPEGTFPHMVPARAMGRIRAHVGCFADQVYPIQALSRLSVATGDKQYLRAASACGDRICDLQGAQGQWWWHYDQRSDEIVEGYPVYSVHQHAMAPMALFELAEAGGPGSLDHISRGFDWLYTHPESLDELVAPSLDVVWRKVGRRREPRKLVRGAAAILTYVRKGSQLPWVDRVFPAGWIDHECRPYELGWLLYAWAGNGVLESLRDRS